MQSQEVTISSHDYVIKAELKIPDYTGSTRGIVLVHGAIVNRKSLSRESMSLASYLCETLNAYVITPDYLGETFHRNPVRFDRFSEIIDFSVRARLHLPRWSRSRLLNRCARICK